MWAALCNDNPKVIITLLNAGGDVNAQGIEGMTPLMWAAWHNQNPEVVAVLLKADADGKAKSNEGKTAFDYAKNNDKLKGTDALKQLEEASK